MTSKHLSNKFFRAVWLGNINTIQHLINDPLVDVNYTVNGKTPFLTACDQNNQDIIELLLNSHRIDVNKKDDNGNHASDIVFSKCNAELMVKFLQCKRMTVDVNKKNELKQSYAIVIAMLSDKFIEVMKTDTVNLNSDRKNMSMLMNLLPAVVNQTNYDNVMLLLEDYRTDLGKVIQPINIIMLIQKILQNSEPGSFRESGLRSILSIIQNDKRYTKQLDINDSLLLMCSVGNEALDLIKQKVALMKKKSKLGHQT